MANLVINVIYQDGSKRIIKPSFIELDKKRKFVESIFQRIMPFLNDTGRWVKAEITSDGKLSSTHKSSYQILENEKRNKPVDKSLKKAERELIKSCKNSHKALLKATDLKLKQIMGK